MPLNEKKLVWPSLARAARLTRNVLVLGYAPTTTVGGAHIVPLNIFFTTTSGYTFWCGSIFPPVARLQMRSTSGVPPFLMAGITHINFKESN